MLIKKKKILDYVQNLLKNKCKALNLKYKVSNTALRPRGQMSQNQRSLTFNNAFPNRAAIALFIK